MDPTRGGQGQRRADRRRRVALESLEGRSLMATAAETFAGPALDDLIAQAGRGANVNGAIADRMLGALQSQLQAGPLADLTSEAVTPDSPIAEAQKLELSFEQDVARQLMSQSATTADPSLGRLAQALDLDGRRVVADLVSLYQQAGARLINYDELGSSAGSVISSLTDGPIHPLGTSLGGMARTTSAAVSQLKDLSRALADGLFTMHSSLAMPAGRSPVRTEDDSLIIAAALNRTTLTADAELDAYRASVQAATRVGAPAVAAKADAAIDKLEAAVAGLSRLGFGAARAKLNSSIAAFDAAVLGKSGVFGPHGAYSRASRTVDLGPNAAAGPIPSSVVDVSGTAGLATRADGTASLTATLIGADGSPIAGEAIHFTIDGSFLGDAVTNSDGVATLGGLTTGAASNTRGRGGVTISNWGVMISAAGSSSGSVENFGTDTGAIVASFGGDSRFLSGQAEGDLTVNPPPVA